MYMYDSRLGDMDVEIHVPEEPRDARISYGYKMDTFEELTEEELDYLNEKYSEDVVQQATLIVLGENRNPESIKLLH